MKRTSLFLTTVTFLIFCSITIAANPVNWTFDAETMGEDVSWDSNPNYIDNYYTVYEYHWEITKVEAHAKMLLFWTWIDVSDLLDEVSGDGVHYGTLPATVLDERIQEGDVGADIKIVVDEDGYGHATVENITFGTIEGFQINGVRIEGNITINGSVAKPIRNATQNTYFTEIQDAIDNASNSDTIIVNSGTYQENINFSGKSITLTSTDPLDRNIVARTMIRGTGNFPVVRFQGSETPNCNLIGFTITGGQTVGGIFGNQCGANISRCLIRDNISEFNGAAITGVDGTIDNCTIMRNTAELSSKAGALADCDGKIINCVISGNHAYGNSAIYNCNAEIINCTIADNTSNYGAAIDSCNGKISNLIVYYNQPAEAIAACSDVSFCCLESYYPGPGNIFDEPDFVSSSDYHLMSQQGSWDITSQIWVIDTATSKCIDAGAISSSLGDEYSSPDNIRVNMGAYGATAQASKTPPGWSIIADITNDGIVNIQDFAWMAEFLHYSNLDGDFDRNQAVNYDDLAIMQEKWLNQTTDY